ncbi:MAG TPA: CapA family protein [Fimbriimonadaceae bacterium]|nr:CapA family protein [Fimbriimonadaceae bacterium]
MIVAPLLVVAAQWRLVLCGDIMLNGVSPKSSPFAGIAPQLKKADLVFANLEVPMTTTGSPTKRKSPAELKARKQFVLRANSGHLRWLKPAGIAAVSLANNHALDYGPAALAGELRGLDKAGIKHAGAGATDGAARAVTVLRLENGVRVGLVSGLAFVGSGALYKCTPATAQSAGVNALELGGEPTAAKLAPWIRAAHERCDVLVVAFHGGIERQPFPTSYQVTLAHAAIDAGADVVWGHHPHVLQGVEIYKGHPILYSMGNLVSPTPAVGGLVELAFKGSSFASCSFIPTRVSRGRVNLESVKTRSSRMNAFSLLCEKTASKVHGSAPAFVTD